MCKKTVTIFALCLATVVSQAPVASAKVISGPGLVPYAFKCC